MAARTAARRIKWGILCLPLAGLVSLEALVVAGDYIQPADDLEGFAEQAVSTRSQVDLLLGHLQLALLLVGAIALYAYLFDTRTERWALAGLVAVCVGAIFGGAELGIGLSQVPATQAYLEGQKDALEWAVRLDNFTGVPPLLVAWGIVTGLLSQILGNLLFGVGIWRSGTLPQGAAVLWIGAAVLGVVSVGNPFVYLGAWIAALIVALDLGGSSWIAYSIWHHPMSRIPVS